MILRDRCSTSYDLASLFRGRRSSLDKWIGNIAKRIGTRPSALHATFHFWRTSRRVASFLMLSTLKNEEESRRIASFLTFVKFKHWGSLAELLHFWCCQVQNRRTSRRIAWKRMATWIGQPGDIRQDFSGYTDEYAHVYLDYPYIRRKKVFFPFGILWISSSAAADQVSSFRVACAVDRILSRNKLKFF